MSLVGSLSKGAVVGAVAGLGLGFLTYRGSIDSYDTATGPKEIPGDRSNFISMPAVGVTYGVALAALGHYAGRASLIGSGVGLLYSTFKVGDSWIDHKLQGLFTTAIYTMVGSAAGYGISRLL